MNLDITPDGDSTPKVRLYEDSMDVTTRGQQHQVQKHAVLEGSNLPEPGDEGLQPGEIQFSGRWFGTDASTLADRLETILDDTSVTKVNVAAASGSSRYDGTYRLADRSETTKVLQNDDRVYRYTIILIET